MQHEATRSIAILGRFVRLLVHFESYLCVWTSMETVWDWIVVCISQFQKCPSPPRANPRALAFFFKKWANSPGWGNISCLNAPGWGRRKRVNAPPPGSVFYVFYVLHCWSLLLFYLVAPKGAVWVFVCLVYRPSPSVHSGKRRASATAWLTVRWPCIRPTSRTVWSGGRGTFVAGFFWVSCQKQGGSAGQ